MKYNLWMIRNQQLPTLTTWYCLCYINQIDFIYWICLLGTWKGYKLDTNTEEDGGIVQIWEVSFQGHDDRSLICPDEWY